LPREREKERVMVGKKKRESFYKEKLRKVSTKEKKEKEEQRW